MNDYPIFYNEADEWARAMFLYDSALKELNTRLDIWNREFKLIHQYNPIEHVTSRIKTPQSIAKKMRKYDRELNIHNITDYVNDIAGIRIICSFSADIYRIADLLKEQSDIKILKIKDYIKTPKENGYMSYHMIVAVPVALSSGVVDTKVEIQIRTIAMDFWASLEHKIYYKFEGMAPSHIRRELKECADLVGFLDKKMLSINEEVREFSEHPYAEYTGQTNADYSEAGHPEHGVSSPEVESVPQEPILKATKAEETASSREEQQPDDSRQENNSIKNFFKKMLTN